MLDLVKSVVLSYTIMAASWWVLVEVPARRKAQQHLEFEIVRKATPVPPQLKTSVVTGSSGPICVTTIATMD